jgi:hypothetical protein
MATSFEYILGYLLAICCDDQCFFNSPQAAPKEWASLCEFLRSLPNIVEQRIVALRF